MKNIILLLLLLVANARAQDVVLATIDNEGITAGEVLYAFKKNRQDSIKTTYDTLDQYLDRYINFKLKVAYAKEKGLDTLASFQSELNTYLSDLKKPYTEGLDQMDELIEEAYERINYLINASHILIKLAPDALPKDTLQAYNFLDSLRTTVQDPTQFSNLAVKYSEDGSARIGGNLGWFSTFSMVYPFESAAYQTKVGEVSQVIRSQFGYHLVFVNEKVLNRGKVKTSHLFISNQLHANEEGEKLVKQAYDSLRNGSEWNGIVNKFSEDPQTSSKGGGLPFAGFQQLPNDYLLAAFELNVGEISTPIKTQFGWHIIRLDDIQPLPALDMIKNELEEQVKRSGRNELTDQALIKKLKSDYDYKSSPQVFQKVKTSTDKSELIEWRDEVIFTLKGRSYTIQNFIDFDQKSEESVSKQYREFEKKMIIAYADSIAPIAYPDFGYLMQEYREGLLLFEVMQSEVWEKAIRDTVGQKIYFREHIKDYPAPIRWNAYEIRVNNNTDLITVSDSLKALKLETLIDSLSNSNHPSWLKIAKRKVSTSEIASFEGFKDNEQGILLGRDRIYLIIDKIESPYFDFEEIKGLVISDYQQKLDEDFIAYLRGKYRVQKFEKRLQNVLDEEFR